VGQAADTGERMAKQAAKQTEGLGGRAADAGEQAAEEAVRPVRQAADAAPDAARRLREQALEPGAQKVADNAVPMTKQVTDGARPPLPYAISGLWATWPALRFGRAAKHITFCLCGCASWFGCQDACACVRLGAYACVRLLCVQSAEEMRGKRAVRGMRRVQRAMQRAWGWPCLQRMGPAVSCSTAGAVRPAGKAIAENAEPVADQIDAGVIQPAKQAAAQVRVACVLSGVVLA